MNVIEKAKKRAAEIIAEAAAKTKKENEAADKKNAERNYIIQAVRKYLIQEISGAQTRFGTIKVIFDIENSNKICDVVALEVDKDPPSKTILMSIEYANWTVDMIGEYQDQEHKCEGISIWHMPNAGEEDTRQYTFSEYTQEFEHWLVNFMAGIIK